MAGQIAALRRGDIDGVIMDVSTPRSRKRKATARILVRFGDLHGVRHPRHLRDQYADRDPARHHPRLPQGLVRDHRLHARQQGRDRRHRHASPAKGRRHHQPHLRRCDADVFRRRQFNPKGLATLAKSFVELHTLPAEPDMSKLYTEAFLPREMTAMRAIWHAAIGDAGRLRGGRIGVRHLHCRRRSRRRADDAAARQGASQPIRLRAGRRRRRYRHIQEARHRRSRSAPSAATPRRCRR